ncbi:hypothetical protein CLOM621_09020 [Clostridium sp. M62/1]|nr:hypothetical protein CLOM621_09020 [Clostridium sp. M62/1]
MCSSLVPKHLKRELTADRKRRRIRVSLSEFFWEIRCFTAPFLSFYFLFLFLL